MGAHVLGEAAVELRKSKFHEQEDTARYMAPN